MTDTTSRPLTAKGERTRSRIVAAAATLMVERGVASVSLDEVGRATSTSKSQMYHYFASKEQLVAAVVDQVGGEILAFQGELLRGMETVEDIERWADAIVSYQGEGGTLCGCPLGTLASELSGHADQRQVQIEKAFIRWEKLIEEGLARMVDNGRLDRSADPHRLAVATLAALQGGLLMSKATQDGSSLRIPLDSAIDYIRSFLVA